MENIVNIETASQFERLVRAYKHLTKVLKEVDEKGRCVERMGATGVVIVINKGDALHLRYQSLHAEYAEKINSYNITHTPTATA